MTNVTEQRIEAGKEPTLVSIETDLNNGEWDALYYASSEQINTLIDQGRMSKLTAKMVKKQGAVVIYISGAFRHYVLKTKNGYKFLSMMGTEIIAKEEANTFSGLSKKFRGGLKIGGKV